MISRAVVNGTEIEIGTESLVIKVDEDLVKKLGIGVGTPIKILSPNRDKSQFDCHIIVVKVLGDGRFKCKYNSSTR